MVVQEVRANRSTGNAVCQQSVNSKDRAKSKYKNQVCSNEARSACVRSVDHKSNRSQQCCPYDGKQVILHFYVSRFVGEIDYMLKYLYNFQIRLIVLLLEIIIHDAYILHVLKFKSK